MVKLEMNSTIQRAIQRAAKARNFVRRMSECRYTVVSGKSEAEYSVKFVKGADGFAWAQCDCPAGKEAMVCHHIISAGWLHKAICKMRKA